MKETTISDIERVNVAILILGSILSFIIMKDFKYLFSFAVASAIMILNFRLLRRILEGGLIQSTVKKKALLIVLPLKFLILASTIVVILIWKHRCNFLSVGLTTVFFSIIAVHSYSLVNPMLKRRTETWSMKYLHGYLLYHFLRAFQAHVSNGIFISLIIVIIAFLGYRQLKKTESDIVPALETYLQKFRGAYRRSSFESHQYQYGSPR